MTKTRIVLCASRRAAGWVRRCAVFALAVALLAVQPGIAAGQSDWYPLPERNPGHFGFPYDPPLPGEPGVTLTRRYMLDAVPELNFQMRPQDELWLVSSRDVVPGEFDPGQLVCKRARGHAWDTVPLTALLGAAAAGRDLKTVLFIHGHRTDEFWCRRRGKQAYQALVGDRPNVPPIRFVLWAWPSETSQGVRVFQEYQEKQERTRIDGYWLGYFLSCLPEQTDPILMTYSLGTQVAITGLCHLRDAGFDRQYQVLSIAPVTRCDWPQSDHDLYAAAASIRELSLIQNDQDIATRAFRIYCKMSDPERPCPGIDSLAQSVARTQIFQVTYPEGCEHNLVAYASIPRVARQLDEMLSAPPLASVAGPATVR